MSLRTGTFLILLTQLINKVTAFYGILALFTSFPLNAIQLSMYIYSLFALGLTIYLAPHIRKGEPWHCLAFAQSYAVDTLINACYTIVFTVSWFMVLASHDNARKAPGGQTIGDTGGFTSPKHNVSQVDVVAAPQSGAKAGQDAIAIGLGSGTAGGVGFADAVFNSGSIMSVIIMLFFWTLRVYAVFVVLSYARQVLRQHISVSSAANYQLDSGSTSADVAENPFAITKEQGQGWKGKVGRRMLSIGRSYWLGKDDEDETWIKMMGGKFRKTEEPQVGPEGTGERERRRRSGTGPPRPPPGLVSQ